MKRERGTFVGPVWEELLELGDLWTEGVWGGGVFGGVCSAEVGGLVGGHGGCLLALSCDAAPTHHVWRSFNSPFAHAPASPCPRALVCLIVIVIIAIALLATRPESVRVWEHSSVAASAFANAGDDDCDCVT